MVVKRNFYLNKLISKKRNGLRLLVMGRKKQLFANTPGGVRANTVIYNSIEAAKESNLYPCRY